jgi:hypothetical protein
MMDPLSMVYASGVWWLNSKSSKAAGARAVRCAVAGSRCEVFEIFSAVKAIETNRLGYRIGKNEKSEDAKRSEPNIGEIPIRLWSGPSFFVVCSGG